MSEKKYKVCEALNYLLRMGELASFLYLCCGCLCFVFFPHCSAGCFAVRDCGISCSLSLSLFLSLSLCINFVFVA